MTSPPPGARLPRDNALQQARRAIDGACTRDRGRLLGLWSKWSGKPGDEGLKDRFAQALAASLAAREARAASLPANPPVDEGLPIAAEAERIVALIRRHQVVVVAGETGSGKTTQLPKLCIAAGRGAAGMIGCTQPRRIAARAVARRVAEELQAPLGGLVGFQVRFNDNVGERTAVKFMTDGILLAEVQSDRWLSAYDTLIIDEAHERSLNIDFLLGYLRQILPRRPDLKIIVTSATIDADRFAEHFASAAQFQIFFGNAKAVIGLPHQSEARPRRFADLCRSHQYACRFRRTTANAPAQLVQLCEPESVCRFDHDQAGIWNINANFNHCRRDQQPGFPGGKGFHHSVFFRAFHPAMD